MGFFDHLDWGWLWTFIQRRINEGGILRLIGQWLQAGILEGEEISYSDRGTPQGGVISPLLANIYLHCVLDKWLETELKPRTRGHCFLVRFTDDCVPRRHAGGRSPPCSHAAQVMGAPRRRRTGGGFKPPTAAAFKRGGGERAGKRQGATRSGEDQGDQRK
jgi:hypothetical protein